MLGLGLGIGMELGISEESRSTLVDDAARLGYASVWTNAHGQGVPALDACERWLIETGLPTGIAIMPTPETKLSHLSDRISQISARTGQSLILGVGAGHMANPEWRETHKLPSDSALATMRQHVLALKSTTRVPVLLGGLGPKMLRLAGAVADGAITNWLDPNQLAWARRQVDAGARAAGRDGLAIPLAQYIRVCVDQSETAARRALAKKVLEYVQPSGHWRRNFARMGLDDGLMKLHDLRARGVSADDVADEFPDSILMRLGAWGSSDVVAARLRELSHGLEIPIVRIVMATPVIDSARAVVRACAPRGVAPAGPA